MDEGTYDVRGRTVRRPRDFVGDRRDARQLHRQRRRRLDDAHAGMVPVYGNRADWSACIPQAAAEIARATCTAEPAPSHTNHSRIAPTPPATVIRGNRNRSSRISAQPRRVVVALVTRGGDRARAGPDRRTGSRTIRPSGRSTLRAAASIRRSEPPTRAPARATARRGRAYASRFHGRDRAKRACPRASSAASVRYRRPHPSRSRRRTGRQRSSRSR